MGANLVAGGATCRVWAPNVRAVYVLGDFNGHKRRDDGLLVNDGRSHWLGSFLVSKTDSATSSTNWSATMEYVSSDQS